MVTPGRALPAASRRQLLLGGAAAFGSLLACSDLLSRTEIAHRYLTDPALDAYRPVLEGLATAVLALEDPRFSTLPNLAPAAIVERLLEMFPLEEERRYLGLQKTLLLFDTLELFANLSGPPRAVEEEALTAFEPVAPHELRAMLAAKRDREHERWRAFASGLEPGVTRFVSLPLAAKRAYYGLWGASDFLLRRELYSAIRALLFITVYSLDEVWPAIGYGGPLVGKAVPGEPGA